MLHTFPVHRALVVAVAALGLTWLSTSSHAGAPVVVDLGRAPAGTIDGFEVEVRNASCDEPQSFGFAPRDLPWLKLVYGNRVQNVSRGKSKLFAAEINLTGLKPGQYAGRLDIICDTCGDFVLSRCHIDTESVTIKVEVVARRK